MSEDLLDIIGKMSYDELKTVERDLSMGIPLMKSLVTNRMQELETSGKSCAVCGGNLGGKDNVFTLVFGPAGLKRKASFCAIDCLGYFIDRLKEIRRRSKEGMRLAIKNS